MKTIVSLLLVLAGVVTSPAQTNRAEADLLSPVKYSTDWKPNSDWYRSVLSERTNAPVFSLGRREYTVQGPLVEAFRPVRTTASEDFIDGKLRRVPILSLVIPYKMPTPPDGKSKYFRWKGESNRPWHSITQVSAAGCAGDNRIHTQPSGSLISVGF